MTQVRPERKRLRYQQVMDELELQINRGKYALGERLPSFLELSKSLQFNHLTIRKGIQGLAGRGLLEIRPRVGVFVTARPRPAQRKLRQIVLGCRQFMLEVAERHPALAAYVAGAHRTSWNQAVSIQTMFHHRHKVAEELGSAILARQVDGFIATGGGVSGADAEFFRAHRIPFVHCGPRPHPGDWAVSVHYSMGRLLQQSIEHLRQLGHQRIAFLCWELSGDDGAIRREFTRLAFDHRLGDPRELLVLVDNPEGDAQWEQIENFFDLNPLPTGVVVFDEFMADILLAGCERRGIKVPDDLSVVSLHDSLPFGHRVPLTAPDSNKQNIQMIQTACELLEQWMDGHPPRRRQVEVTMDLITKASSGPVPARRALMIQT